MFSGGGIESHLLLDSQTTSTSDHQHQQMLEDDHGRVWEVTDPNMDMLQLQPYASTDGNITTTQPSKDTSRHGHSSLDNIR